MRWGGRKDRPAVLVISKDAERGSCIVVPITHRESEGRTVGIEVPAAVRMTLGLDDRRQWIIISEGNRFVWPGPDLRPVPDAQPPSVIYGRIPRSLFVDVLTQLQTLIRAKRTTVVAR
ncbi:hypothetical protein [Methylobacterium sp. Leaf108]|uniref:hypothetical protein n=1 Tax=Methylobacterium sp. Leaf108 TaxID=1736256 RepID=UPI0006FFC879|nr:hypothetical protein [Methylobacterium sp. Leaf108]KQP58186.1 hypothetical protein ASF39_18500 [Methylobacterium sp. Leaf108]